MQNSIKSGLLFYSLFSIVDSATVCAEQVNELDYSQNNDVLFAIFSDEIALTANQLDKQRGGFTNKNGFKISIGFEKVVVVNGKLEAKSQFFIPLHNIKDKNNNQFKGLAIAMAALQERLEQDDNNIKGNHTPDQLDSVADNLSNLTDSLSGPSTNAPPKPSSLTLTTGTKSGGDNYTDALLSMLSAGQSLLDTAPINAPSNTNSSPQPDVITPGPATPAPQGTQLTTIDNPEDIPTANPLSNDLVINSGSNNQVTATPNYSDSMTSVVMNSQDSSLIQSFQLLNIKIDNLGEYRSKSINALVLPQIIHSLR